MLFSSPFISFHFLFFRVDQSLANVLINFQKIVWCLKKPYIRHDLHCYCCRLLIFFVCRVHQLFYVYSWKRLSCSSLLRLLLLYIYSFDFNLVSSVVRLTYACVYQPPCVFVCMRNVRNFVIPISQTKSNKKTSTTSATTVFKICLSEYIDWWWYVYVCLLKLLSRTKWLFPFSCVPLAYSRSFRSAIPSTLTHSAPSLPTLSLSRFRLHGQSSKIKTKQSPKCL